RVAHRDLRARAQRGIRRSAVDVVDAEHVGEEQHVDAARLERAREVQPVLERAVATRAVARVPPEPRGEVVRRVHAERVEDDLAHDADAFGGTPTYHSYGGSASLTTASPTMRALNATGLCDATVRALRQWRSRSRALLVADAP